MKNKIKLVIMLGGLNTGGAERVAVSYCNYLVENEKDIDITMVLFNENKSLYDLDKRVRIVEVLGTKHNALLNYFQRKQELKKLFAEEKPDIIFTFFEKMTLYALKTKNKEAVLISSERANIHYRNLIGRMLCNYTSKRCDGYIFQTNSAKLCYSKKVQDKSIVIPNAVSTYSEKCSNKKNVISAMGRLTWQKGFDTLIKAFSIFYNENKDYSLDIYGDGEDRQKLQSMIKELNLESSVHLLGNQKNAINEISKSKIFVLSSRYEGMPNALLEAMASGVASISTNCPFGPDEIIVADKNGILVDVDDISDLAEKMKLLANDNQLRESIEKESVLVRDKYSSSLIYNKYISYMKDVLKNNK